MDKLVYIHTSYNIPLSLIIKQSFTVLHKGRVYNTIHFEWRISFLYNIQTVSCPVCTPTGSRRPLPLYHNTQSHTPSSHQPAPACPFLRITHTKSYPIFAPTGSCRPLPSYHTHKVIPRLRTYRLLPVPSFVSHKITWHAYTIHISYQGNTHSVNHIVISFF